jgi:arylsulfatase
LNTKPLKLLFVCLAAITLLSACGQEPYVEHQGLQAHLPESGELNFLVVSFDALRADALGLYGYPRNTSPELDAFAAKALVFDSAYSSAPTTPTSFASAFTGQYPYRVFLGWNLIPSVTLAGLMQDAGFHTFGIFNNTQLVAERHFNQGFVEYSAGNWPDEQVLQEASAKLRELADRRFFGWIHFITPHTPYEFREISAQLAPAQTEGRYALRTEGTFDVANEEELKRVRDLYDGEIFYGDHLFGQLIAHMRSLGLLENTVIIVTSDHGEEFMEHGQLQHNALFEELIRIPLIIHHPGLAQGVRTDARYINTDLLPTVAAMAGIEIPEHIDGVNLLQPFDANRYRVATAMTNYRRHEMANERLGKKFILTCRPEFGEELYDLVTDPGEKTDLILDQPGLAGDYFEALNRITILDPCELIVSANRGKAPEELLTPEQIEDLRSLGYIQ